MMGDEERILLKQDQEYRFDESVVPKQAYQHSRNGAMAGANGDADGGDSKVGSNGDNGNNGHDMSFAGGFKLLTQKTGGRVDLLGMARSAYQLLGKRLAESAGSIKTVRDLWRFQVVRVASLMLGLIALYYATYSWNSYQNRAAVAKAASEQASQAAFRAKAAAQEEAQQATERAEQLAAAARLQDQTRASAELTRAYSAVDKRVAALELSAKQSAAKVNELSREKAKSEAQLNELGEYTLGMINIWQRAIQAEREIRQVQKQTPYVVYSINSQRAWLRNQRDELISVRPGSQLPGYGMVLKLDAQRKMVVTEHAVIHCDEKDF